MKYIKTKEHGFTLVELAIVMIIIGLLIGGVLKGQQLVQNAKVSATITQLKGFTAAYNSFLDAYASVPGDMRNATTRVSGCNTGNFCVNGDGNSIVGDYGGDFSIVNQAGTNSAPEVETSMFWKELALADLITGVDPTADPTDPAWGESHPSSAMRGGYHILYSTLSDEFGSGHAIRLQNRVNQALSASDEGSLPLSPAEARSIDMKLDDGKPDRGSVTADWGASNCDPGGEYANTESKNCVLYYALD